MNLRRLMNEIKQIEEYAEQDAPMFKLARTNDDMFHWEALIRGPGDSLYEGYGFKLDIKLPDDYPTSAISLKFVTPIKHVNVNGKGDICMDILKNNWSSALNMRTVLISLISLLGQPNPEDPLNSELAELYRKDQKKYAKEIKKACESSAIKLN